MTEIPEPDYDDDDDDDTNDDTTDPVSGFYDNEAPDADAVPPRVEGDADDDAGEQADVEANPDYDDEDVDDALGYDDVRAKLEAISVYQKLRGSLSAADQGCHRHGGRVGSKRSPRRLPLNLIVRARDARWTCCGLVYSALHAFALFHGQLRFTLLQNFKGCDQNVTKESEW